jgi:hypothetical protein
VPGNRAAADRNDDLGAGPTSQTAYAESTEAPWIVTILPLEFFSNGQKNIYAPILTDAIHRPEHSALGLRRASRRQIGPASILDVPGRPSYR